MRWIKTLETEAEGARLAARLMGEPEGIYEQIRDLYDIRQLNHQSTRAWERENNYGGSMGETYCKRQQAAGTKARGEAVRIARARGWQLDMSSLTWRILDRDGKTIYGF